MSYNKTAGDLIRYFSICRLLHIIICSVLLFACAREQKNEYVKKPANLLSKDKMISFLIDLHLAEAKVSYAKVKNSDSTEILFRNYEQYLFEKHHIDDSAYYQSYEYYLAHMDQLEDIYAAVVDSLSVLNSTEKAKDLEDEYIPLMD